MNITHHLSAQPVHHRSINSTRKTFFRPPLFPPFPKSSLQQFRHSAWWDGLNKTERPTCYNIARVIKSRRSKVGPDAIKEFVPEFKKDVIAQRMGNGQAYHYKEYWMGKKPDGSWYVLSNSAFSEEKAYAEYIKKLCYWGRRPTEAEDEHVIKTAINTDHEWSRDIFDVRQAVSLETKVGSPTGHGLERVTLGVVLGAV